MGHAVLSDDIAALTDRDGAMHVQPAYPQIRLWPDSVAMLYGTPDALPPLTPTWDKRALALTEPGTFHQQPLPLRAVYLLAEPRDHAEPAIEDVGGAERLPARSDAASPGIRSAGPPGVQRARAPGQSRPGDRGCRPVRAYPRGL
jgi:hypothetical protein